MEEEPPEQKNQSLNKNKTLVFSFESIEQRSDFIFKLFSFDASEAHFS